MGLKTAVIGLGPHGKRLVECVLKNRRTELAAVVDRDMNKLDFEKLPAGTNRIADVSQLWNEEIDVALIATNGPSHASIAIQALDSGIKYIMVTKPVATTLADAKAIVQAGRKENARIVVDHGLRYDKTYEWIIGSQVAGLFGELKTIYIQRPGIGLGCLGVHSFDLANAIAQSAPLFVSGWVDNPLGENPRGANFIDPGGLVVITYENGVRAVISQVEDGAGPMSVELNYTGAKIQIDEKGGELRYVRKLARGKFESVVNPHGMKVSHNTLELMDSVINNLISEDQLKADVRDGMLSFEILLAAYLSDEQNHAPVNLPISDNKAAERFLPVT